MNESAGHGTLWLSHHSLRYASMEERAAAAAAAGLDGIGLSLRAYRRWRDGGHSDEELADILGRHGQRLVELEALHGWALSGEQRDRAHADEELAFHLADAFGPTYLQAIGPYEGTTDDVVAAYAALCDRASAHRLTVGIEFLPFTNIPDIASAADIAESANRGNGGVCVDAWHFFRGTPDFDSLAAVPGELIANIQINDGPLVPEDDDYLADCLTNRRCPGDGEFDLVRFMRTIAATGCTAPVSIEVISTSLQALAARTATERMTETTRQLLAAADSDP